MFTSSSSSSGNANSRKQHRLEERKRLEARKEARRASQQQQSQQSQQDASSKNNMSTGTNSPSVSDGEDPEAQQYQQQQHVVVDDFDASESGGASGSRSSGSVGYTSTGDHSSNDNPEASSSNNKKRNTIAQDESAAVFRLRLLVLLVLLLAAAAVSVVVYYLTSAAEKDEFETQFIGAATKVLTNFEDIIKTKLSAIGSLALQTSLFVKHQTRSSTNNQSWPFVTMDDWEMRSGITREISGSLFTRLVPLVEIEDREAWEEYSVNNVWWLQEANEHLRNKNITGIDVDDHVRKQRKERNLQRRNLQQQQGQDDGEIAIEGQGQDEDKGEGLDLTSEQGGVEFTSGIASKIFEFDDWTSFTPVPAKEERDGIPYFPLWQESPTFGRDITNFDTNAYPPYAPYMLKAYQTGEMAIGGLDTAPPGDIYHPNLSTSYFAYLETINAQRLVTYQGDPMSSVFVPVFDDFDDIDNRKVKAIVFAVFKWSTYFTDLLPANFPGLLVVLENNCEGAFTYKIIGEQVQYMGPGDRHDPKYYDMEHSVDFTRINRIGENNALNMPFNQEICEYSLHVYPTSELEDEHVTSLPIIITFAVLCVFGATACVFLIFNQYVEARQKLVYNQAVKSTAIVSSLFPDAVRDRLMEDQDTGDNNGYGGNGGGGSGGNQFSSGKTRLKSFLNDSSRYNSAGSKPIADLFPHCTVFFADIAGFTAWSSTREPSAVFTLLETIYQSFDASAKRRGVFKVETIGDSYVAVTGLPNPNASHALVMARFAAGCLTSFREMTKKLDSTLGPDTSELGIRVGLHSGPVTAGVLRGERSRFQLFGDTVNTAARMESSGISNRIQISTTTAELLKQAGREDWIRQREDTINVKGKGVLSSFWLEVKRSALESEQSTRGSTTEEDGIIHPAEVDNNIKPDSGRNLKEARLVNWITDLFLKHIQDVVARQDYEKAGRCRRSDLVYHPPVGKTSLDEVAEVIRLPEFDAQVAARAQSRGRVSISPNVVEQLRELIHILATLYNENSFHNFEHACHVTMAADKFMNRIVTPDMDDDDHDMIDESDDEASAIGLMAEEVHDYTMGTSDPLTLVAILFSALIHDCDHRGVSNMQLAKEDKEMASIYSNKSIAEQNSLDIAWDLLMSPQYADLRSTLFVDRPELMRFRQVTVNVVLATDIFDKELNDLRKGRWNKAFSDEGDENGIVDKTNLRATIVIEHIIQASDVSHCMQHWHIYRKWNEKLFMEMYSAFKQGRMGKSPAEFWYQGEISFFDNYIIPLAKKLSQCGVFGVSSDECLNYAKANRNEWAARGEEVVQELMARVDAEVGLR